MTEHSGALFQRLRKDRHLTLQQCADDQLSTAAISKFERGQMAIGYERFLHLLGRIDVSVEEFLYLQAAGKPRGEHPFNSQADVVWEQLIRQMAALTQQPITEADLQRFEAAKQAYLPTDRTPTRRERFSAIGIAMLQAVLAVNHDYQQAQGTGRKQVLNMASTLEQMNALARPLVAYLYSVEHWGYFELFWFASLHIGLSLETTHQLLPLVVQRSAEYANFGPVVDLRFDVLFGVFSDFINGRKLAWAKETLDMIAQLLAAAHDLTRANHLLFCRGWYAIIAGDVAGGTQAAQQAISIERILKQPQAADDFAYTLKMVLRNQANPNEAAIYM